MYTKYDLDSTRKPDKELSMDAQKLYDTLLFSDTDEHGYITDCNKDLAFYSDNKEYKIRSLLEELQAHGRIKVIYENRYNDDWQVRRCRWIELLL